MQKRLSDVLKHVQSDLEIFTMMAGHGAFTMLLRSDMLDVTGVQAFGLVCARRETEPEHCMIKAAVEPF